ITREASFRALEAFISPSAEIQLNPPSFSLLTFALASRLASASAAMALCSLDAFFFFHLIFFCCCLHLTNLGVTRI
uniref:Uncharacterized protein n=1 Tax=Sparus aurata TaxID=8175 RepID=A0A671UHK7_SPAAU